MLRISFVLAIAVMASGCINGSVPKVAVAPVSSKGKLHHIGEVAAKELEDGTYPIPIDSLVVTSPIVERKSETWLNGKQKSTGIQTSGWDFDHRVANLGLFVRSASLRNPGVAIAIVRSAADLPLSQEERDAVLKLAAEQGAVVLPDTRIPVRYGPDGKTPILMKPGVINEILPDRRKVLAQAGLQYPSRKAAERARKYFDETFYSIQVFEKNSLSELHLKATMAEGNAGEERPLLNQIAKATGGRVLFSGYSADGSEISGS